MEGAKKFVGLLSKHYHVRKMRIVLNGRKVGKTCDAWYYECEACSKKKALRKSIVLHELYHHLAAQKSLELSESMEEREANSYTRRFLKG